MTGPKPGGMSRVPTRFLGIYNVRAIRIKFQLRLETASDCPQYIHACNALTIHKNGGEILGGGVKPPSLGPVMHENNPTNKERREAGLPRR